MGETSAHARVVGGLAELASALQAHLPAGHASVDEICRALEEFGECVRYLNTRRSDGAVLQLNSEAAVQDALYLILRPWIRDLIPETPTDKIANRFSIGDFVSRGLRLIVEVKFVRDRGHGKAITKELHDDIEVYRHNTQCDTLLFFVYDPDSNIPDERELRRTIEQSRVYDGRPLKCLLIVKP